MQDPVRGAVPGPPACRRTLALALAAALVLAAPGEAAASDSGRAAALAAWSPRYAELCVLGAAADAPPDLRDLVAILSDPKRFGGYTAALVAAGGVVFCHDPRPHGCRGYFEPASGIIALDPDLEFEQKLLIAVHELRHTDQLVRGFEPSLAIGRSEYVRFIYALEADAQALATLYAWSEAHGGLPALWDAAVALEHYEDIAAAFAESQLATGDPGLATRAAFVRWYESGWRRESYYLSACVHYLDRIDDTHAIERYDRLPADAFDELCTLPDGTNYGCHATEAIRRGVGRGG